MIEQLRLTYFWSLTEQADLDLDYTPCRQYEEEKRNQLIKNSVTANGDATVVLVGGGNVTTTFANTPPNALTIDIDQTPITIWSKEKPNIFARWVYKAMGVKWVPKC